MTKKQHKFFLVVLVFTGLFIFNSCSTEKTGWAHRTYHSILTRYNGYFNAKEIMLEAEMKIDNTLQDDYMKTLPVYKELPEEQLDLVLSDMDIVIEKCARVIRKNSIKKRGKEYTNWVDDSYLLIGKAYYYKEDYPKAYTALNYAAKKFKDQESRFEARFWLARLYSRDDNNDKALKILSMLETEKELPEYLKHDIHKLYTSIYLEEGNMESAMQELQLTIRYSKKKKERLRLTYLYAQLLKDQEERQESMKVFALVLKMHPEYKMEFYTRIQMAMAYSVGSGDAESVEKELKKMLKDEKYLEFQDQIYYALGEMSYSGHDTPQALEYFELSTQVSEGNDYQKATSFLRLGEIYFLEPEYEKAQSNYDSCVTYMPNDYPDGDNIRVLASNLKDLVEQILIIQTQDSLQLVAKMEPDDRDDLIADIIKKRVQEEERKQLEEELKAEATAEAGNTEGNNGPGVSPGSPGAFGGLPGSNKWYFYNPTVRESGASEFKKKWGSRKNEDDWRRSSKEQAFDDVESATNQNEGGEFYVDENGDTMKVSGDWLDPAFYIKDLPLTPEKIEASNDKIIEAYYKLATIYKEQMDEVLMSIETLEELDDRFHPNVHTVDSYYRLYRMYYDEEDMDKSNYYKNKILKEYPESQYAQVIRDPDFLERENVEYEQASKIYQKAYVKYYQRGYYQQTVETCNQLLKDYSQTRIKPKAMFLRALAIGHLEGEASLRRELKVIVNAYSKDEYGQKAQELIDGLDLKNEEAKAAAAAKVKSEQQKVAVSEMVYEEDNMSKHNFVILIHAKGKELSQIKSTISDFNRKHYKMEGLKMSAVVYKKGVQMISIKSFANAKQAMNYQKVFENEISLEQIIMNNPDYFIVSFTNYALFFKTRDDENYKIWAEVKYKDL